MTEDYIPARDNPNYQGKILSIYDCSEFCLHPFKICPVCKSVNITIKFTINKSNIFKYIFNCNFCNSFAIGTTYRELKYRHKAVIPLKDYKNRN